MIDTIDDPEPVNPPAAVPAEIRRRRKLFSPISATPLLLLPLLGVLAFGNTANAESSPVISQNPQQSVARPSPPPIGDCDEIAKKHPSRSITPRTASVRLYSPLSSTPVLDTENHIRLAVTYPSPTPESRTAVFALPVADGVVTNWGIGLQLPHGARGSGFSQTVDKRAGTGSVSVTIDGSPVTFSWTTQVLGDCLWGSEVGSRQPYRQTLVSFSMSPVSPATFEEDTNAPGE